MNSKLFVLFLAFIVFSDDVFCTKKVAVLTPVLVPQVQTAKVVKVKVPSLKAIKTGAVLASAVVTGAKAVAQSKQLLSTVHMPVIQEQVSISSPIVHKKVIKFPTKKMIKFGSTVAGAVVGSAIGGAKALIALKKPVVKTQVVKKTIMHVPIKPVVQESLIISPETKFKVIKVQHEAIQHQPVVAKKVVIKKKPVVLKPFLKGAFLGSAFGKAKAKIFSLHG